MRSIFVVLFIAVMVVLTKNSNAMRIRVKLLDCQTLDELTVRRIRNRSRVLIGRSRTSNSYWLQQSTLKPHYIMFGFQTSDWYFMQVVNGANLEIIRSKIPATIDNSDPRVFRLVAEPSTIANVLYHVATNKYIRRQDTSNIGQFGKPALTENRTEAMRLCPEYMYD